MNYEQDHKDSAKAEQLVMYKSEFDFRFLPPEMRPALKKQQWGTMPLERAKRIIAILHEDA